jgi:hypothetical protein
VAQGTCDGLLRSGRSGRFLTLRSSLAVIRDACRAGAGASYSRRWRGRESGALTVLSSRMRTG